MKTILGLDPGIGNLGWAIVKRHATGYTLIDSGYQTTSTKATFGDRLDTQYIAINNQLVVHQPDALAIEACFFNRNISSHNTTIAVIAIAELSAYRLGIPTLQIKPPDVKVAVGCGMQASKDVIKTRVNQILKCEIRNHHEADAAAVAISALLKQGVS